MQNKKPENNEEKIERIKREQEYDPLLNYNPDYIDSSEMEYILLVACSDKKREDYEELEAINLYNGNNFRIARKYLRENYNTKLNIKIISAKYGLIDASKVIQNYNYRLQEEDIESLNDEVLYFVEKLSNIKRLCVNVGFDYEGTVKGIEDIIDTQKVVRARGEGIGRRMAIMKEWLYLLPYGFFK